MKNIIKSIFVIVCVLGFAINVNAFSIGVSMSGNVYNIDESTGEGSLIGHSGFTGLNALATDSSGNIFAASGVAGGKIDFLTIDPETGFGDVFTTIDYYFENGIRGLAFSEDDTLFALRSTDNEGQDGDELLTIDINTHSVSSIGYTTGFNSIQALDFSSDGTLYGWDIYYGLLTIDPFTGIATDVNQSVGAMGGIQSIDFTLDGTLIGGRDELYSISIDDGTTTLIGSGDYSDIRGIAVSTVPEPSTILILGFGLATLVFFIKKKNVIQSPYSHVG